MTILNGQRTTSPTPISGNPRMSGDLSKLTVDYWQTPRYSEHPTHTAEMRPFVRDYAAAANNLPVTVTPVEKTGSYAYNYKQDFYYRVHVRPRTIDFGNLVNTEIEEVVLWNAFFGCVLMQTPSAPDQTGIQVSLPVGLQTPYVLKPTEEVVLTVTADISGPPTIDATFTIEIDGVDYSIDLTGRRILLWPFPPNWRNPLDDTYAFKSWALRSADGHVQSGSQWGNNPRREIAYNSLLTRDDAARAENMLFGWQSRFYGVACWSEKTNLTAEAVIGTRDIPCATANLSFSAGGFVVIYKSTTEYETAEIESVEADNIVVTADLKASWPEGTRVYPVFSSLINSSISGTRRTDGVVEIPVSFECDPITTYGNTPAGSSWPTYKGEELYLGRLNWAEPLPFEYDSDRLKIDFNTAKFYSYSGSDFTPTKKTHNWLFKNRAEAADFLAFLGRRQGVARPVYMPTGNTDLTMLEDPVIGSSFMDVIDTEYGSLLAAHPARRDIIILLKNGTYYLRRITSAENVVGGTRLNLDVVWASTFPKENIKRISFLNLFRLTSNKATIRWANDGAGTASLTLITDRND